MKKLMLLSACLNIGLVHAESPSFNREIAMQWSELSCVIQPSPLGGVGVFATHNIAAGTVLFTKSFELRVLKAKDIPAECLEYCIYINEDEVIAPERFDRMEIGWYINHSDTPNIAKRTVIHNAHNGSPANTVNDLKIRSIYALRDIKAGEEILIDYNYLDEPEHLKEEFYKPK